MDALTTRTRTTLEKAGLASLPQIRQWLAAGNSLGDIDGLGKAGQNQVMAALSAGESAVEMTSELPVIRTETLANGGKRVFYGSG